MNWNELQWDGNPGHYEVYYVSLTDRGSGTGAWIRYTMLAPEAGAPTCSLWFMAMGLGESAGVLGRKTSFPVAELSAAKDPFELRIGPDSVLTDGGMSGSFEDVAWNLRWERRLPAAEHVHPWLRRIASTLLFLPHPALDIEGTLTVGGKELALEGARGGQAHLWGSKHANRWCWAHCDDFESLEGEKRTDDFLDGVSVYVPRLGREVGPNTPIVGRFGGRDFASTSPVRVTTNKSSIGLTTWVFTAVDGARKIDVEVTAPRESLAGVTYHDPDGQEAYCYNSEVATMRVTVWERDRSYHGYALADTLVAPGRAHFEYAQREPVPGLTLHVQ
jgi:hypothetical protein